MDKSKSETYNLIKAKDKHAIALLYNRYGSKLFGFAINSWKVNEDDAWDLIYQTLYKTIENSEKYTFETEEKFASFIFKIFINLLRNHYRDANRKKDHISFVNYDESQSDGTSENNFMKVEKEVNKVLVSENNNEEDSESENMKLLKAELEKLDEWEKILLLLRAQNMPYSEITRYVDKPEEQLKVYYQRLKNKILQNINSKTQSQILENAG